MKEKKESVSVLIFCFFTQTFDPQMNHYSRGKPHRDAVISAMNFNELFD